MQSLLAADMRWINSSTSWTSYVCLVPKGSCESDDLSDVEALVMQEAEQEIAVEERIRDAYRKEEEEKAGNLKGKGGSANAAAAPVREIVYCEGEEEKVSEIQVGNPMESFTI